MEQKLNSNQIMIERNLLNEFPIATTFLQNFKEFWAKLNEYLKTFHGAMFSKIHTVIHFQPCQQ